MSSASDELPKKLVDWLKSQGYPLEMIVAQSFQKSNFTVSLSDFYSDTETNELREIDVTALRWSDMYQPTPIQVCCRIECKSSKERPWIVFVSKAQPELWFPPSEILCSENYFLFLMEAFKNEDFRKAWLQAPLLKPKYTGHGVTQAFTTGLDVPFKAVTSAIKASLDRVIAMDKLNSLPSTIEKKQCFSCVAFPVIVVEGRLFEAFLDNDEETHVNEVQSSVLSWKGLKHKNSYSLVHVVTKEYLSSFIEQVNETTSIIIDSTLKNTHQLQRIAAESRNSL